MNKLIIFKWNLHKNDLQLEHKKKYIIILLLYCIHIVIVLLE